jgi:D-sedoheptulose 7-phosphate isomerase|tara:strand:- start:2575 stop:3207 length:633 start_codon:yes stop_codon:yes gene_type:complete
MFYLDLVALYKKESSERFYQIDNELICKFIEIIFEAYEKEKTIFVAGNGGTAGYLQNFVVDFNMHPFVSDDKSKPSNIKRNKFKCVNLCADQATITGITNDLGYENVYLEQLKYQLKEGDVFIGMSGSGNSKNIVNAMQYCVSNNAKTVLLTRNQENKCNEYADLCISLNGKSYFPGQTGGNNNNFHFEDIISKLTHLACGVIKQRIQNA